MFYNVYTYGVLCIHLAEFPLTFLNMSLLFKKFEKFHIFSAYSFFYFLTLCQLRDHIISVSDSLVSVLKSMNTHTLSLIIFFLKLHCCISCSIFSPFPSPCPPLALFPFFPFFPLSPLHSFSLLYFGGSGQQTTGLANGWQVFYH